MRRLYEIALADKDIRTSPYCWTVKLALKHKGLDFETVPLGFAEKQNYPDPEYGKAPVLVDEEEMVKDSAVILDWLDRRYPEKPLARTEGEKSFASFLRAWLGANIFPPLGALLIRPLYEAMSTEDQAYVDKMFRDRFKMTVDDYARAPGATERLAGALKAMAPSLAAHDYFGGDAPNISDYVAFGPFMWARAARCTPFCETPPSVARWVDRMLDLFGGYARAAKSVP